MGRMAPAWGTPPTRASGSQRSPPPLHQRRCLPCQRPQGLGGGGPQVAPPGSTSSTLLAQSCQGEVAGCQRRSSKRLTKSHSMRMSRLRYAAQQRHIDTRPAHLLCWHFQVAACNLTTPACHSGACPLQHAADTCASKCKALIKAEPGARQCFLNGVYIHASTTHA